MWRKKNKIFLSEEMVEKLPRYLRPNEQGILEDYDSEFIQEQTKQFSQVILEEGEGTNEQIYVEEQTQQLNQKQLEQLKMQGDEPSKIVEIIANNNQNFNKRFEFSKQKYLNKKQKKYNLFFKLEKCSFGKLCQYFIRQNQDFVFPREDYLYQLMNCVPIKEKQNLLVVERAKGLVIGILLMKSIGMDSNNFYMLSEKGQKLDMDKYETLRLMGLQDQTKQKIKFIDKDKLIQTDLKFEQLVLAIEGNEMEAIKTGIQGLRPNGQISLFTKYYERATGVYNFLSSTKQFVNIIIQDFMYRRYQALPLRTHPEMTGNMAGGFVVTAIKIFEHNTNQFV